MDDKTAYRQKLEAKLDRWRAEIDKLEAQMAVANVDTRSEVRNLIVHLRKRQTEVQEKLEEMNKASSDAWKEMTHGIEKVLDDFATSVSKAIERVDKSS
ncbi:hypothetical protein OEW28_07345 [Defluviimonas sp. WL0002]|uniref:Coiled coil domain-containing protein n=1 Tax=Albidovulum marisflavi TaxID=2984159 RepID=A0ABT2ZCG4_9RHOB|nr:hypothetical protein [Defluviimonas sp. WL0002]MCV2868441.1 hypothetical protein [Defluviimonas sp. WL0002]